MKNKLKISSVLSLLAGAILLLSFFIDHPALPAIRNKILSGAECLFMLILLLSLLDTLFLHVREIGVDSSVRIVHIAGFAVFLTVLVLGFLKGSTHTEYSKLIYMLQQVMESASSGLICIGLIYALYRLPSQEITPLKSGFIVGIIFFLLIYSGIDHIIPIATPVARIITLIKSIPQGCLTGLFLGLGLGAVVTGIHRIFTGGHKPGGNQ